MKTDAKLGIPFKKDIKSKKEAIHQLELDEKFELGPKCTNNNRKEKRGEEKTKFIKGEALEIKMNTNKNGFDEYKNILRKDLNNKGNKTNLKKYFKNIKRLNIPNNIYIIIIFFSLIIPNNNMIEYKSSEIILKIRGQGEQNILNSNLVTSEYPNRMEINGIPLEFTNNYNFEFQINTVKLIWNDPIITCFNMFFGCFNIIEIDLSHFDTSQVEVMADMFVGCSRLTSINLSNLNTAKVKQMFKMFYGCSELTSLDLSSFDTSNVIEMHTMFKNCRKLTSLDLSNFDTSKCENMGFMFSGCSGLTSLDLSNFVTSTFTHIHYMFEGCSELTSLNLANFESSNIHEMQNMFSGCSKLAYINLKNYLQNNLVDSYSSNIFYNVPDNIVVCLNENNDLMKQQILQKNCYTLDCSDAWQINQKRKLKKNCFMF